MVNNLHLIKPLLLFPNKDSFYFIQIIQRKKDHPGVSVGGSNNNSRLLKAYYIVSLEHLDIHMPEMIHMANAFNARVSIVLNPRSFRKAGFHVMQKIANQMSNDDFRSIPRAYDSICGEFHSEMDKRWIIDIDTTDPTVIQDVQLTIALLHDKIQNRDYNILAVIPSKSGVHIITNPFNEEAFKRHHPDIEIHRNNPTNLYIP